MIPKRFLLVLSAFALLNFYPSMYFGNSAYAEQVRCSEGLKIFLAPPGHDAGIAHTKMFHGTWNGRPTLIKYTDGISEESVERHRNQLLGMRFAEKAGGPEVFLAGRMDYRGEAGYYIEFEEIFPGQKTQTWKFSIDGYEPDYSFLNAPRTGDPLLLQIAKIYLQALENNVAPGMDPDFIFTDKEVRPIDTGLWQKIPLAPLNAQTTLKGVFELAQQLSGSEKQQTEFKKYMVDLIRESQKLRPEPKASLLEELQRIK